MTDQRAPAVFPTQLAHKHGLDEWWPMLLERSAETLEPGKAPVERFYRCQKVGCTEMVRIDAEALRPLA
jgi:hypothetical protein